MINYDGYGFMLVCPTSCPSPTQLHSTPPYPTTCTVTSPQAPSNTTTITIPHHTREGLLTTLPQSGQNVSVSIAPALKMTVGGGGGGAKLPKCLATAARAINFCPSPEKVGQRGGGGGGGTPTHFSRLQKFVHKYS